MFLVLSPLTSSFSPFVIAVILGPTRCQDLLRVDAVQHMAQHAFSTILFASRSRNASLLISFSNRALYTFAWTGSGFQLPQLPDERRLVIYLKIRHLLPPKDIIKRKGHLFVIILVLVRTGAYHHQVTLRITQRHFIDGRVGQLLLDKVQIYRSWCPSPADAAQVLP